MQKECVDKKYTETNVKKFLKEKLPSLQLRAGIKSLKLESTLKPAHFSAVFTRLSKEQQTKHEILMNQIYEVLQAIDQCPYPHNDILKMTYVYHYNNDQIISRIPYERAQFYRLKHHSLLLFADSYETICDLHVYKR